MVELLNGHVRLAKDDYVFFCPRCDSPLRKRWELGQAGKDDVNYHCGLDVFTSDMNLMVHPDSHTLVDYDVAQNYTWYHSTNRKNWKSQLKPILEPDNYPLIHIGTYNAAIDNFLNKQASKTWYLYEVQLTAKLIEQIKIDNNLWPIYRNDYFNQYQGPTRYVNRWESPGSISIITPADMIKVVRRRRLDPAEFV